MNDRIEEYAAGGRSPFGKWFDDLAFGMAARVDRYIRRMEAGNFGAAKTLRGGGDNRQQDADINAAVERWERYKKAKV